MNKKSMYRITLSLVLITVLIIGCGNGSIDETDLVSIEDVVTDEDTKIFDEEQSQMNQEESESDTEQDVMMNEDTSESPSNQDIDDDEEGEVIVDEESSVALVIGDHEASISQPVGDVFLERDGILMIVLDEMSVQVGDIISTGSDSSVVLQLDQGKTVMILSESVFLLLKHEEIGDNMRTILALKQGTCISDIDETLIEGSVFEIMTPCQITSIRGTVFSVKYNPESGIAEVIFFEGVGLIKNSFTEEIQPVVSGQKVNIDEEKSVYQRVVEHELESEDRVYLDANPVLKETLFEEINAVEFDLSEVPIVSDNIIDYEFTSDSNDTIRFFEKETESEKNLRQQIDDERNDEIKPADDIDPIDDNDPIEDVKPVDDNDPIEDVKPTDDNDPIEDAKPTDDNDPIEDVKPTDDNDQIEDVKPDDNIQPDETGAIDEGTEDGTSGEVVISIVDIDNPTITIINPDVKNVSVDGTTVEVPKEGVSYYFDFMEGKIKEATGGTYGLITMDTGEGMSDIVGQGRFFTRGDSIVIAVNGSNRIDFAHCYYNTEGVPFKVEVSEGLIGELPVLPESQTVASYEESGEIYGFDYYSRMDNVDKQFIVIHFVSEVYIPRIMVSPLK